MALKYTQIQKLNFNNYKITIFSNENIQESN